MSFSPDFNWNTFRNAGFRMSRNVEETDVFVTGKTRKSVSRVHGRCASEDLKEGRSGFAVSFRNEVRKAVVSLKKSPVKLKKIEEDGKRDPKSGSFLTHTLNEDELQVKRFTDAIFSNEQSCYKKTGFTSEKPNIDLTSADKIIKEAKKIIKHGIRKKIHSNTLTSNIESFWYTYISKDPTIRWDLFEDSFMAYIKYNMTTDLGIISRINWQKFITKFFLKVSKETNNCFIWVASPSCKSLPNLTQKTISLQDFSKIVQNQDLIFLLFSCIDETPSPPIQKQNDVLFTYACGCRYKGQWYERIRDGVGTLDLCTKETYSGIFTEGKFHEFGSISHSCCSYKGFFKKNLPNGFGKMVFPNGSIFEGIFEKGLLLNGTLHFSDGGVYKGEIVNSEIEGKGVFWRSDGEVCKGMWHFGKLNGEGRVEFEGKVLKGVFFDGELSEGVLKCEEFRYEGGLKDRIPNGKGEFKWKSGERFKGDVVNGVYEGQGSVWYVNGDCYEGSLVRGVAEGLGKWVYVSGKVYSGEFFGGVPHGRGKFEGFNDQVLEYEGQVENGMLEGQGRAVFVDGSTYVGQFYENCVRGKGKMTIGKVMYDGEFVDFMFHGAGELRFDTCYYLGTWIKGLPDGNGDAKDAFGNFYSGGFTKGKPVGKHKLSEEFLTALLSFNHL